MELETARNRLLFLHRIVTRRMIQQIRKTDPLLEKIFTYKPKEISEYFHLPLKKATTLYARLGQYGGQNIKIRAPIQTITVYDPHYPNHLKNIPDPPVVLYAKGDLSLLHHSPSLSVIGTRNPTTEAPHKLTHIVTPLIQHDWLIVSGLAYGVDSLAHELALQYNGKTITVLGGGFNHVYPKSNLHLFHNIVQSGLALSEYPPDVAPRRYHFPERNRIISGLSEGTLVIEATERSGTFITVDQALEQGKEVYAVPGSPLLPQTVGCNRLIQEGAKLVMCANDILEDYHFTQK